MIIPTGSGERSDLLVPILRLRAVRLSFLLMTETVGLQIQSHIRFKVTLIYYDTDTHSANCRGNPLCQATKRHLNNS